MTIRIERADLDRPDHADAVRALVDMYARDPNALGRPLPAPVLDAVVPRLRAHPASEVLLAWEGAELLGGAICIVSFSTFAAAPVLNLHDLAVMPAARGRGVGSALLRAVEERARRLGCAKVTLEVAETNRRAHALYAREGYDDGPRNYFLSKGLSPEA